MPFTQLLKAQLQSSVPQPRHVKKEPVAHQEAEYPGETPRGSCGYTTKNSGAHPEAECLISSSLLERLLGRVSLDQDQELHDSFPRAEALRLELGGIGSHLDEGDSSVSCLPFGEDMSTSLMDFKQSQEAHSIASKGPEAAQHGEDARKVLCQRRAQDEHRFDEDGFEWTKYSHKNLRLSGIKRLYYMCAYKERHHCPARKMVDRRPVMDKSQHWAWEVVKVSITGTHNHRPTCRSRRRSLLSLPSSPLTWSSPSSPLLSSSPLSEAALKQAGRRLSLSASFPSSGRRVGHSLGSYTEFLQAEGGGSGSSSACGRSPERCASMAPSVQQMREENLTLLKQILVRMHEQQQQQQQQETMQTQSLAPRPQKEQRPQQQQQQQRQLLEQKPRRQQPQEQQTSHHQQRLHQHARSNTGIPGLYRYGGDTGRRSASLSDEELTILLSKKSREELGLPTTPTDSPSHSHLSRFSNQWASQGTPPGTPLVDRSLSTASPAHNNNTACRLEYSGGSSAAQGYPYLSEDADIGDISDSAGASPQSPSSSAFPLDEDFMLDLDSILDFVEDSFVQLDPL